MAHRGGRSRDESSRPARAPEERLDWALTLHGGLYGEEAKPGRPLLLLSARRSGAGGSLSETRVKRGDRAVRGGEKELLEKLGRNDLCPCGSGRRFQEVLHAER